MMGDLIAVGGATKYPFSFRSITGKAPPSGMEKFLVLVTGLSSDRRESLSPGRHFPESRLGVDWCAMCQSVNYFIKESVLQKCCEVDSCDRVR